MNVNLGHPQYHILADHKKLFHKAQLRRCRCNRAVLLSHQRTNLCINRQSDVHQERRFAC
jgi:hypothetical protein